MNELIKYIESRIYDVDQHIIQQEQRITGIDKVDLKLEKIKLLKDFKQILIELRQLATSPSGKNKYYFTVNTLGGYLVDGPIDEKDLEEKLGKNELPNGTKVFEVSNAFKVEVRVNLLPRKIEEIL